MKIIQGTSGNDILSGGTPGAPASNDELQGREGNDTYTFSGVFGFDRISDTLGIDQIQFDASIDPERLRFQRSTVYSGNLQITLVDGNDQAISRVDIAQHFLGSSRVETLALRDGSVRDLTGGLTIKGYAGQTEVIGTDFGDRVYSRSENETLSARLGDDRYVFSAGFGTDKISDTGGFDTVALDASIDPANVRIVRSTVLPGDLVIAVVDANDTPVSRVQLSQHFIGQPIERLELRDGTVIDLTGGLPLQGYAGAETLNGTGLNDTLEGRAANETFAGGLGDDVYNLRGAFGQDLISDTGGNDRVRIIGPMADSEVRLTGSSVNLGNLVVALVDGHGSLISELQIVGFLRGGASRIETLELPSGAVVDLTGGLTIQGWNEKTDLRGTAHGDSFIASVLDESMRGDDGDDTYIFSGRFGNDLITEASGRDTIVFDGGIDPDHVAVFRDKIYSGNLVFAVTDNRGAVASSASVVNYFASSGHKVELFTVDGRTFEVDDFFGPINGTGRNDRLFDLPGNSVINGGGGNDVIKAFYGDNIISGGGGKDRIISKGNRDSIDGGGGKDRIDGGRGNDTIDGGRGDDTLKGGPGKDVFVFEKGFGHDTILDFGGRDRIDLSGMPGKLNFRDLEISEAGRRDADTLIEIGKFDILLQDVAADSVTKADFLF